MARSCMNRVLWGLTLTLVLTLVCIPTFAQAVAESVLLGAGSSTATVKAGSALNSALNRGSKQLAGRVQRHTVQNAAFSSREDFHRYAQEHCNASTRGRNRLHSRCCDQLCSRPPNGFSGGKQDCYRTFTNELQWTACQRDGASEIQIGDYSLVSKIT